MKGFDYLVEARIQEAVQRGVLDDLPGAGKPANLDDLAGLSREERIEALLLRSAGGAPEEVDLLREIAALREALAKGPPPDKELSLKKQLADKSLRLSVLFEGSGRFVLANEALRFMP
ncbi:MAG: DUF1992 domain-containing protein [Minicystis sp.]